MKEWRLASPGEAATRCCRWSAKRPCPERVVAALNRGGFRNGLPYDCWWFYCEDHARASGKP